MKTPTLPQSADVSWLSESALLWYLQEAAGGDAAMRDLFSALRGAVTQMQHALETGERQPPQIVVSCSDHGMRTYPRSGVNDVSAEVTMRWPFNDKSAADFANAYSALKSLLIQSTLANTLSHSPLEFGVLSVTWDQGETNPVFHENVWERAYRFSLCAQPRRVTAAL